MKASEKAGLAKRVAGKVNGKAGEPRKWPAAAVTKAISLKRQGASDRAISRELRAMKVIALTGGKWWSTTVQALLRDSGYKGAAKPKARKEVAS